MLPILTSEATGGVCNDGDFCAGDTRSREMPGLAAIHTIFVREHNRIAKLISGHLGHMGDERVFQEARRINIAQMQNIVYNAWLPIIPGKNFTDDPKNGLQVTEAGTTYNPKVDPSMETVLLLLPSELATPCCKE